MLRNCRAIYSLSGGKARGKTPRRIGGYFRNDADHRDFTAIGTAAGKLFCIASNRKGQRLPGAELMLMITRCAMHLQEKKQESENGKSTIPSYCECFALS